MTYLVAATTIRVHTSVKVEPSALHPKRRLLSGVPRLYCTRVVEAYHHD